ncbi:syntaxin 16 [Echinococcus multilocularis]|uniref:Syntaxin 16 n=1 Tax=Echinococcus multilocularis TaxID=6211 RepID=A0A087W0P3_ECHMU|nr:syntaxin 16 [Echinococcus multilocularis]
MGDRKLTDTFLFMRNNAIQNRHFSGNSQLRSSDKEKLLGDSTNIELGATKLNSGLHEWQNMVKSINFQFTVIRQKIKELVTLHDRHIMAAKLDDNLDEDQEIELQTKELTQLFTLCHRQLSQLTALKRKIQMSSRAQPDNLMTNTLSSLARTLQELSLTFRKVQSQYLNELKARDERIRGYLNMALGSELTADDVAGLAEFDLLEPATGDQTQLLLAENTKAVERREQEITQIVRSLHELNEIFRDVAQLVVDQGTLVDRIDYNVEQTQIRVQESLKQLTKADSHQKRDKKLLVIFVLACLVMVLGTILVGTCVFHASLISFRPDYVHYYSCTVVQTVLLFSDLYLPSSDLNASFLSQKGIF